LLEKGRDPHKAETKTKASNTRCWRLLQLQHSHGWSVCFGVVFLLLFPRIARERIEPLGFAFDVLLLCSFGMGKRVREVGVERKLAKANGGLEEGAWGFA